MVRNESGSTELPTQGSYLAMRGRPAHSKRYQHFASLFSGKQVAHAATLLASDRRLPLSMMNWLGSNSPQRSR